MSDFNSYVLLAGVVLIWAVLAYSGYTDLVCRLRKRRGRKRGPRPANPER